MKHPFTCLVSGPTGSGKTSLVKSIIEQQVIEPSPKNVLWLYAADQPLYKGMKGVTFHQGIPEDIETRFNPKTTNLLIIDDLMTQCHSDERMTRLFSVGSSHKNLSIIFIIHNLFHQGKEMRNISLNTHYIILFKNPRDSQQIATLARQMYPGKSQFLIGLFFNFGFQKQTQSSKREVLFNFPIIFSSDECAVFHRIQELFPRNFRIFTCQR